MNASIFNLVGYISIGLWLLVPVLWALHALRRPRRWLCHVAVPVAALALGVATIHSKTYINRIQADRTEQVAAAQEQKDAARKAAEDARAGDVAQVRFAEDGSSDFLDQAGMDDADRKYMATFDEDATPDWKKEKKDRSEAPVTDDSLEAMIDTSAEPEKAVDTAEVEATTKEPIMMPEKRMILANKLDGWNLRIIRYLLLLSLCVVLVDYLKRINRYDEAYLPLPLPSAWVNSMTPVPPVRHIPSPPRRTMQEELDWLTRKGDTFLYLTDSSAAAVAIPETLFRMSRAKRLPVDVIHVTDDNPVASDFIFETLWFGRASFVVDSESFALELLQAMLERLELRKARRAHVRQTVQVLWDCSNPLSSETVNAFERLGSATGVVLVTQA